MTICWAGIGILAVTTMSSATPTPHAIVRVPVIVTLLAVVEKVRQSYNVTALQWWTLAHLRASIMNTTIGKGITITGSIQAQEPVTIAGTVNGDVLASDYDVTVEVGARVDGAVTARRITVRGRSTGRLIARELVRLQTSAAVKADIAAPKLALEEGASFNGCVEPAKTDAAMRVAAYRNNRGESVVSQA
jgi:cytoskeletal protein CcmA (bactofilin family)